MMKPGAGPVIVIAGPTASGKSALALRLARHLRGQGEAPEILCADSVTVYRGVDIGAAKPSTAERAEIPHHLLDVADPRDGFTAGDFVRLALPVITGLHSRGTWPIVVGGTGFYLRALLRGMAAGGDEEGEEAGAVKAELQARAAAEGYEALYRELLRLDPGSAPVIHPNDHYRILRALQAMRLYGKPWSELNRGARAAGFRFPGTRYFCLDVPREELEERILARSRAILEGGLLEETRALLASGIPPEAKPLQSIGYKECLETLSGLQPERTLCERIAQSTRRLAKQQRTWFRGEAGVEWLKPGFWDSLLAALPRPPEGKVGEDIRKGS